jgi:hypothetical protein
MASPYSERIARLETLVEEQRIDTKEIKSDVKTLLEHKWKQDGKRMGIAAVVAMIVSLAVPFLTR